MITLEQYVELLPYRNIILEARAVRGPEAHELKQIYAGHGRITNVHCQVCVGDMLNYFSNAILEYEQHSEAKST